MAQLTAQDILARYRKAKGIADPEEQAEKLRSGEIAGQIPPDWLLRKRGLLDDEAPATPEPVQTTRGTRGVDPGTTTPAYNPPPAEPIGFRGKPFDELTRAERITYQALRYQANKYRMPLGVMEYVPDVSSEDVKAFKKKHPDATEDVNKIRFAIAAQRFTDSGGTWASQGQLGTDSDLQTDAKREKRGESFLYDLSRAGQAETLRFGGRGVAGVIATTLDATGFDGEAEKFRQVAEAIDVDQGNRIADTTGGKIGSFGGQVVPSVVAVGSGAAGAALLYYGLNAFGNETADYRKEMERRGLDGNIAAEIAHGAGAAAAEIAFEKIGLDLLRTLPDSVADRMFAEVGDSLLKDGARGAARVSSKYVTSASVEGLEEAFTEITNNVRKGLTYMPETGTWEGVPEAFVGGMVGGAVINNFGMLRTSMLNRRFERQAEDATNREIALDRIRQDRAQRTQTLSPELEAQLRLQDNNLRTRDLHEIQDERARRSQDRADRAMFRGMDVAQDAGDVHPVSQKQAAMDRIEANPDIPSPTVLTDDGVAVFTGENAKQDADAYAEGVQGAQVQRMLGSDAWSVTFPEIDVWAERDRREQARNDEAAVESRFQQEQQRRLSDEVNRKRDERAQREQDRRDRKTFEGMDVPQDPAQSESKANEANTTAPDRPETAPKANETEQVAPNPEAIKTDADLAAAKKAFPQTPEGMKAYSEFYKAIPIENRQAINREQVKNRRRKAAKKGVETKQRRADQADQRRQELLQTPEGRRVLAASDANRKLGEQAEQGYPPPQSEFDAAAKRMKDAEDMLKWRNTAMEPDDMARQSANMQPTLAERVEKGDSGDLDAKRFGGVPWIIRVTSATGEREDVAVAARIKDSVNNSEQRVLEIVTTASDTPDPAKADLMVHFDKGDHERSKRARQLVTAIAKSRAMNVSIQQLKDFINDGTLPADPDTILRGKPQPATTPEPQTEPVADNETPSVDTQADSSATDEAQPETMWKGNRARYTGNTEDVGGTTFYEIELLEGSEARATKLTANAPDGSNPLQERHAREAAEQRERFARLGRKQNQATQTPREVDADQDIQGGQGFNLISDFSAAMQESVDSIAKDVSNVRYGEAGTILIDHDGKTYETPEPMDVMPMDAPEQARNRWAAWQILKRRATVVFTVDPAEFEKMDQRAEDTDAGKMLEVRNITQLHDRRIDGQTTADEHRRMWAAWSNGGRGQVRAEIRKWTKRKLMVLALMDSPFTRSSEKKDELIDRALNAMEKMIAAGGADYTWTMGQGSAQDARRAAYQKRVDELTDADLQAQFEERQAREAQRTRELADPQTIYEFERAMRVNGKDSLTTEQKQRYDALVAEREREKQKRDQVNKRIVSGADVDTATMSVVESVHTKTGADLFTVTWPERIEREEYSKLAAIAKSLGGYKQRKYGKTPSGFTFKDRATADQFIERADKGTDRADVVERIEERQEAKADRNAQAMREKADAIEKRATEKLTKPRRSNTHRQATQAQQVESTAMRQIAFARTMRNAADLVESGKASELTNLRNTTQLEALVRVRDAAKSRQEESVQTDQRARTESMLPHERARARKYNPDTDSEFVKYPWPYVHNMPELIRNGERTDGAKLLAKRVQKLRKLSAGGDVHYPITNMQEAELVKQLADRVATNGYTKQARDSAGFVRANDWFADAFRLQRMGINTVEQLREALRQLADAEAVPDAPDPVKIAEREIVGKKIPGYFPTPKAVRDRVLENADIQPGHTVLEPSAGSGELAVEVFEAEPDAEVLALEINRDLVRVAESKGLGDVRQADFLEWDPQGETFDRVVMNPPFERKQGIGWQDIAHVEHAYGLLKPGGRLVAVMSGGTEYRSDKQTEKFRELVDEHGTMERLPEGSFQAEDAVRTTGVNTVLVILDKPGKGASDGDSETAGRSVRPSERPGQGADTTGQVPDDSGEAGPDSGQSDARRIAGVEQSSRSAIERQLVESTYELTDTLNELENARLEADAETNYSPLSFSFTGKLPEEIAVHINRKPHLLKYVGTNAKTGEGMDTFFRLGADRFIEILEDVAASDTTRAIRAVEKAGSSDGLAFLAMAVEGMPDKLRGRKFETVDPDTLTPGDTFSLHGTEYAVQTIDGSLAIVEDSEPVDLEAPSMDELALPGADPMPEGWGTDGLDSAGTDPGVFFLGDFAGLRVPIDAGTLRKGEQAEADPEPFVSFQEFHNAVADRKLHRKKALDKRWGKLDQAMREIESEITDITRASYPGGTSSFKYGGVSYSLPVSEDHYRHLGYVDKTWKRDWTMWAAWQVYTGAVNQEATPGSDVQRDLLGAPVFEKATGKQSGLFAGEGRGGSQFDLTAPAGESQAARDAEREAIPDDPDQMMMGEKQPNALQRLGQKMIDDAEARQRKNKGRLYSNPLPEIGTLIQWGAGQLIKGVGTVAEFRKLFRDRWGKGWTNQQISVVYRGSRKLAASMTVMPEIKDTSNQVTIQTEHIDVVQGRVDTTKRTTTERVALRKQLKEDRDTALQGFRAGVESVRETLPAMREALREAAKARSDARAGQIKAIKLQMLSMIQDSLPGPIRGKFLSRVARATSYGDLSRAINKMRLELARYNGRIAAAQIARLTRPSVLRKLDNETRRRISAMLADAPPLAERVSTRGKARSKQGITTDAVVQAADALQRLEQEIGQEIAYYNAQKKLHGATLRMTRDQLAEQVVLSVAKSKRRTKESGNAARDPALSPLKAGLMTAADSRVMSRAVEGIGDGTGVLEYMLVENMEQAEHDYLSLRREFTHQIDQAARRAGYKNMADAMARTQPESGRGVVETVTVTLGGKRVEITVGEAMALAAMDEQTRTLIASGVPVQFLQGKSQEPLTVTMKELAAVVNALTPQQRRFVQDIKQIIESAREGTFKAVKDLKGYEPYLVPGYFPRKRNLQQSQTAGLPELGRDGAATRYLENLGMTKERDNSGGPKASPLLIGDILGVSLEHLDDAAKLTHLAVPIRDATGVLKHPEVRRGIEERHGKMAFRVLESNLAAASRANERLVTPGGRFVSFLNGNIASYYMGFNPGSWSKQLGGIPRLIPVLGKEAFEIGLKNAANVSREDLVNGSGYFWERYVGHVSGRFSPTATMDSTELTDTRVRDLLTQAMQNIVNKDIRGAYRDLRSAGLKPLEILNFFDSINARIAWAAYTHQINELHPDWTDEQKNRWVAIRAARAVRRTQNSSSPIDQTYLGNSQRGGAAAVFLLFTSDMARARNRIIEGFQESKQAGSAALAAEAANQAWAQTTNALVRGGTTALALLLLGQFDDFWEKVIASMLPSKQDALWMGSDVVGMFFPYFAPEAFDFATSKFGGTLVSAPSVGATEKALRNWTLTFAEMTDLVTSDDFDGYEAFRNFEKAISSTLGLLGLNPAGSPYNRLRREMDKALEDSEGGSAPPAL